MTIKAMNSIEFVGKFSKMVEGIFVDRNEKNPHKKAEVWCDVCMESIVAGKFSPESVLRALERLRVSTAKFLSVSDLIDEINSERFMEVG